MIDPAAAPVDPRPLLPAEIPGVAAVHDPRPPLTRALGSVAAALRNSGEFVDGVLLSTDGDSVSAATAISTDTSRDTPETARAVADALRAQTPGADRITVQVRRIARG